MKHLFSNSDGTFEITPLACPCCGLPLYRQLAVSPTFIYCPHGQCTNQAMNNGATGQTIEEALNQLEKILEGKQFSPDIPNYENSDISFLVGK